MKTEDKPAAAQAPASSQDPAAIRVDKSSDKPDNKEGKTGEDIPDEPVKRQKPDNRRKRANAKSETVASSDDASDAESLAESKVSQRQPSQLKSSVRSLANKDTNESSFASRKQVDVVKAADVDPNVNSAKTLDE